MVISMSKVLRSLSRGVWADWVMYWRNKLENFEVCAWPWPRLVAIILAFRKAKSEHIGPWGPLMQHCAIWFDVQCPGVSPCRSLWGLARSLETGIAKEVAVLCRRQGKCLIPSLVLLSCCFSAVEKTWPEVWQAAAGVGRPTLLL